MQASLQTVASELEVLLRLLVMFIFMHTSCREAPLGFHPITLWLFDLMFWRLSLVVAERRC